MSKITKYGAFEVNEFITEEDFKLVNFDPLDLDTAFTQNPGLISHFGHLLGRAKRQVANFKTRRDGVKSKSSKRLRDELTKEGKAPPESRIESEMRSDKEFLEVSFASNHAIEVEQTLEALYWAVRGRRNDMEFFADKQRAELHTKGYALSERGKTITEALGNAGK